MHRVLRAPTQKFFRGLWQASALALALATGCGEVQLPAGESFKLSELAWNSKNVDFGPISGVTEIYDDTLVLSGSGAVVLTSGVQLALDARVKSWGAVSVLPAADLSGSWAVAIDDKGSLRRLKNRSVMEDISDRYGLVGVPVRELAPMGQQGAVFALDGQLAVADGQTVTRYDGAYTQVAGATDRVAGIADGKVRLLDAKNKTTQDLEVGTPTALLFDENDKLGVATSEALYRESSDGAMQKIHSSKDAPIRGLVRAGTSMWLVLGDSLALVQDGKLRRAAEDDVNAVIPADAKLFGSSSGDLWTVSSGKLRLLAEDSGGGADQDLWRRNVQPIFSRLCATCHLPGGSSGIDLSTYALWAARRSRMVVRVLDGKPTPMPPAGAGTLTAEERVALKAWTDNMPMQ